MMIKVQQTDQDTVDRKNIFPVTMWAVKKTARMMNQDKFETSKFVKKLHGRW